MPEIVNAVQIVVNYHRSIVTTATDPAQDEVGSDSSTVAIPVCLQDQHQKSLDTVTQVAMHQKAKTSFN